MKAFFDTNVLIYAVTADPRKQQADRVLRAGGIVSVQVLNEFANVARNKLRHDWNMIEFALSQFKLSFEAIVPQTADTHAAAFCFYL
jgi:predicted nucleic acid-binding protein